MCGTSADRSRCIDRHAAAAAAAGFPKQVLVFLRAGNTTDGEGARLRTGQGIGSQDFDVVLMPGFPDTWACGRQNRALLAHEIGHHLGLFHTFPARSVTLDDLSDVEQVVRRLEVVGNDPTLAFDGDRPVGVRDTAPDPAVDFSAVAGGPSEFCQPVDTPITVATRLGLVTFTPPRRNIMSYYLPLDGEGRPARHVISPDQTERMYRHLPR
jgi:hypothetical protein